MKPCYGRPSNRDRPDTSLCLGNGLWPNLEARSDAHCLKVLTPAGDPGDAGSIPALGRSSGGGNGNPLQYSFLGNPVERGAWWAIVHGVMMSQTRLNNNNISA